MVSVTGNLNFSCTLQDSADGVEGIDEGFYIISKFQQIGNIFRSKGLWV